MLVDCFDRVLPNKYCYQQCKLSLHAILVDGDARPLKPNLGTIYMLACWTRACFISHEWNSGVCAQAGAMFA